MDLSFLRPLFDSPGPWVTVHLDATRAVESTGHEVDLRWRALRERLAEQGADAATVAAVGAAIGQQPTLPRGYGLAVFARAGEVALVEHLAAPPPVDQAYLGPLPHAMPLVAQHGEDVAYVRVLADRTGADLEGLSVGGAPRRREVAGSQTFPLRKVQAGGWSHRRYQQAAEESWKRNAGDVAVAAVELAEAVGAEVLVVGGDVRAVQLLTERLPVRWRERVVSTGAGSRGAGADEGALDDVTVQAVAELADARIREVVQRYQAQRGAGTACTGLAAVVTALQRGQVDTVLLVDEPSSTDVLWIGPGDPSLVAVDERTLRAAGVQDPQPVRADAALLRAIVGTGAQLVLVGAGEVALEHGIGAVLRYTDSSTPTS